MIKPFASLSRNRQLVPRRLLASVALLGLVALLGTPDSVQAESWIFMPSPMSRPSLPAPYSSPGLPRGHVARPSVGPFYSRPTGAQVSVGWRNLRSNMVVRGQTVDQFNVWESWVQGGAQY